MSIEFCLAQTTAPAEVGAYVFIGLLTAMALGVAWNLRVFDWRTIAGPVRLKKDDRWQGMFLILATTVLAWAFAPLIYVKATGEEIYASPNGGQNPPGTVLTTPGVVPTPPDAPATTQSAARGTSDIRPDALVKLSAVGAGAAGLVCVLMTFAYRPGGLTKLGFGTGHLFHAPLIGLLAALIVIPIVTAAGIVTAAVWDVLRLNHPNEHDLLRILGDPEQKDLRNLIILSAVVIAPVTEELIFRGHLQTLLGRLFGSHKKISTVGARWLAVLITSAMFASVHPWWTTPPIFVLAVALGYLYERTGNLWACVFLHALFNGSSTALFLIETGK